MHNLHTPHFYMSLVHRSANAQGGHDSEKNLQHLIVNLRLPLVPPIIHCYSKYLAFRTFLLPPRYCSLVSSDVGVGEGSEQLEHERMEQRRGGIWKDEAAVHI